MLNSPHTKDWQNGKHLSITDSLQLTWNLSSIKSHNLNTSLILFLWPAILISPNSNLITNRFPYTSTTLFSRFVLLNNITVYGKSKEECDINLRRFTAELFNLTNSHKCTFSLTSVDLFLWTIKLDLERF